MKSLTKLPSKPRQNISSRLTSRYQQVQNSLRFFTHLLKRPQRSERPIACYPDSPELAHFQDDQCALRSWPDKQTQWWYFTGQLKSTGGEEFGFQCVFFERHAHHDFVGPLPTRLLKSEYYVAHFAISHLSSPHIRQSFRYHQRGGVAQPHFGSSSETTFDIVLDHWRAGTDQQGLFVETQAGGERLSLKFTPQKPLVRHGQGGYIPKSADEKDGSFYCSYSRLLAEGSIQFSGTQYSVHGEAWMDHEKMACNDQVFHRGWDWYSLQFDDHSELMLYHLKTDRHTYSAYNSGTFIDPQGNTTKLGPEDVHFQHLEYWKSPKSGANYPLIQKVSIPKLNMSFMVRPRLMNQEMNTLRTSFCTYWEGAISAQGEANGRPLFAKGYMELVGYDPRPQATVLKLLTLP